MRDVLQNFRFILLYAERIRYGTSIGVHYKRSSLTEIVLHRVNFILDLVHAVHAVRQLNS